MSLIRWNPMMDPFGEIDDVFNRLPAVAGNQSLQAFVPAINMYENDKALVVEMPLAGVKPENVEVNVQQGMLSIKGESSSEHEVDEKNYYRKEVRSGSFYRTIPLPTAVLEDKVSAEFEDGMLKISCPKVTAVETKKVNVKIVKKDKK